MDQALTRKRRVPLGTLHDHKERSMNIGIRLHDTAPGTFEERIQRVHEDGFGCGHLALYKMLKEYPCDDSALTPGYAAYIKRVFDKNDVDIAVLGCYKNLAHPDPETLLKIQHSYMAHIRFMSFLGAGVVGTETGCPNAEYKFTLENRTTQSLSLFIKNLAPVVEYAEKMGVVLAIEPVARHIVWCPKVARKVLDEIASPNLQIIFDPVNLLDGDNYKDQKEICKEAIDLLGDDIAMIHLKDYQPVNGEIKSMACGLGVMDYTDIVKFAKERKPFIHATLEDTVPENAVAAMNHIRKLYEEA